ncbi:MAG: 4Fe-4S binding protein, partial [candidate division KSB1 bacterium]|nr:4Fe-4S binding protein [candidate division KSB1 bacterium]
KIKPALYNVMDLLNTYALIDTIQIELDIEDDYSINSTVECIECMECVAVCPVKAVSYQFKLPATASKVDLSRRRLIQSGVAGVLAVGIFKTSFLNRNSAGKAIRPPGSLEEARFLDRCIRCHECVRICATTGACLQPALLESGWEGLWTPISVPRAGYCEYNCNLCGQVCPTGAIQPLELSIKQKIKMGIAYFDKSRCIPWYRQEDCIVCEEHCPTPDKAIKFEIKEVIKPDGNKRMVKFPYVVEDLCIGCGICVTKCPVIGEAGIFVTTARQQRWPLEAKLDQT